jgi:phosphoglycolate phosphatase-like HAD superfamily hydrolase
VLAGRFLIFDLDQTLIESSTMHDAWQDTIVQFGGNLEDAMIRWRRSAGLTLDVQVMETFGVDEHDPIVDRIIETFWLNVGTGDPVPVEGAAETLEHLYSERVPLYLSTGSYQNAVDTWLGFLGWNRYFRTICASSRSFPKGPAHYRQIIADSGVAAAEFGSRAVTVGDGPYDMQYGLEHGVAVRVGFVPPSARPERRGRLIEAGANAIISDLRELPQLLESPEPWADNRWLVGEPLSVYRPE